MDVCWSTCHVTVVVMQACCHPQLTAAIANNVGGKKARLSMDQILQMLVQKNEEELQELQRDLCKKLLERAALLWRQGDIATSIALLKEAWKESQAVVISRVDVRCQVVVLKLVNVVARAEFCCGGWNCPPVQRRSHEHASMEALGGSHVPNACVDLPRERVCLRHCLPG